MVVLKEERESVVWKLFLRSEVDEMRVAES